MDEFYPAVTREQEPITFLICKRYRFTASHDLRRRKTRGWIIKKRPERRYEPLDRKARLL